MGVKVLCDVCGRDCTQDFRALDVIGQFTNDRTLYVCGAQNGGDFGCAGFFKRALEAAGADAREARKPKPRE